MSSDQAEQESPLDLSKLSTGESVLIAGPPMCGKRRILFDLLSDNDDEAAILVTTKRHADRFQRELVSQVPTADSWETRFVDCVSRSRNVRNVRDSEEIKYVSSPGDLTGIGIAASGFMKQFHDRELGARVGLHTLSTLLMYADIQRVFQFSHVMTGRIEAADFVGVFTLDTTHNTEAVSILQGLFDVFIEVRDAPDAPELRVRGSDLGPRTWTHF